MNERWRRRLTWGLSAVQDRPSPGLRRLRLALGWLVIAVGVVIGGGITVIAGLTGGTDVASPLLLVTVVCVGAGVAVLAYYRS